jgi:hypothetical protein
MLGGAKLPLAGMKIKGAEADQKECALHHPVSNGGNVRDHL